MPSSSHDPDRDLLFGVLAVRLDFVGLDRLVTAVNSRAADSCRPLGEILVDQGDLTPDRRDVLDALVGEQIVGRTANATTLAAHSSAGEDGSNTISLNFPGRRSGPPADGVAVPGAAAARPRRAGRGVRRRGRGAGPRGRPQGDPAAPRRRPRQPRPVPAGGGDHRRAGAPRHRPGLRPGARTPTAGRSTPCGSSRARP